VFGAALVALGGAYLTGLAGLSPALGAFVGGLTLARSELREQVAAAVLPLRDVFSSLFFVSMGTMLRRNVILSDPLLVLGVAAGLVGLKVLMALAAMRLGGAPWRVAVAAAIALAQVGEFSFVLVQTTGGLDLMGAVGAPVFVAAAVVSLLLTPVLVARAPDWALALDLRWSRGRPMRSGTLSADVFDEGGSAEDAAPHSVLRSGHVVIAGFGLNGHNVARVLRAVHVPHLVVDLDPDPVLEAITAGSPALVGDVTQPFIQKQAGVPRAAVLVLGLSDQAATRHACRTARALAPELFIIVRTRLVAEIDELFRLGANQVIPEEFETSIEIFTATLRHLHVPANVIDAQVRLLREERYSLLRGMRLPQSVVEQLDVLLQQGTCDTFVLLQHSPAVGRCLGEVGVYPPLAGMAHAIALVRGGAAVTSLGTDEVLRVGDILVLAGTHAEMDRTFHHLHPAAEAGGAARP
jgi:CPA2 family monovalent cation:H+ antiporter-2